MPRIADLLRDIDPLIELAAQLPPGAGMPRKCRMNSMRKRIKREYLLQRDGSRCWVCYLPFTEKRPPTFDHVVELRHGGSDALSNLKLAHRTCNNDRSNVALRKIRPRESASLDLACDKQVQSERSAR